ncbi:tetratricopeptide repeat protein [Actinoplanes sp. NPDC049596]|uniref:tetratricopeptide repeat protein n=1 Tax=unclassified Actinoplanes TaxID=2626549 RepID=UPI003412F840
MARVARGRQHGGVFEINMLPQARRQARELVAAGEANEARELLERAVEGNRAALAGGEPELIAAMRELAGLHAEAGDPMAARRLLEEAQAAGHRLVASDPLAVMLAYDLAVVADELGNRHVARTNFARVAEHGAAPLGADHWVVAHARAYVNADAGQAGSNPGAGNAGPEGGVTSQKPGPLIGIPDAPPTSAAPAASAPSEPATSLPMSHSIGSLTNGHDVDGQTAGQTPPTTNPRPASEHAPSRPAAIQHRTLERGGQGDGADGRDTSRKSWIIAGAGILVGAVIAATAILTRPSGTEESAAPVASVPAQAGQQGQTRTRTSTAPSAGATAAAPTATAATPPTKGAAPSKATAPTQRAAPTQAAAPAKAPAKAVVTRIVSPANGSKVPYPFDARFTMSAADVRSDSTVVAVLVCVNGRCYLDGKVDIVERVAAPYTIYLGSTKPEGTGVAWSLRLDRLSTAAYNALLAEREARWTDGSWGDKGTTMSKLNPAPVSTVSVIKTGA